MAWVLLYAGLPTLLGTLIFFFIIILLVRHSNKKMKAEREEAEKAKVTAHVTAETTSAELVKKMEEDIRMMRANQRGSAPE